MNRHLCNPNIMVRKATVPLNRGKNFAKTVTHNLAQSSAVLDDIIARTVSELTISRAHDEFAVLGALKGHIRYQRHKFFVSHPAPGEVHILNLGPAPALF